MGATKTKRKPYKCPCAICAAARAVVVKDPFNRRPARTGLFKKPAPAKAP